MKEFIKFIAMFVGIIAYNDIELEEAGVSL